MKRRIVCAALLLAFIFALSLPAYAADSAPVWDIDGQGTLRVSVNGEIPDYYKTSPPWNARRGEVKRIEIAEGVTEVGAWAFSECAAKSVSLPKSLREIGDYAFKSCGELKRISIPAGVTELDKQSFDHCVKLKSVTLPEGLTDIDESAFNCCVSLQRIVLPASLEEIGASAFNGCSALETVYYTGTEKQWKAIETGGYNEALTRAELICDPALSTSTASPVVDIAAFCWRSVALREDGTVLATGDGSCGEINVEDWTDIVQIVVTSVNTFGLKSDGTIVAAGKWSKEWLNSLGYLTVEERPFNKWTDIEAIAASNDHLVGLKLDGSVVIEAHQDMMKFCGADDVSGLKNMTQIIAGSYPAAWYTGGINASGEACVNGRWFAKNAVEICSSGWATLALRADGTVAGIGEDYWGYADELAKWTDLKQVLPDDSKTYGLKKDGTVLCTGNDKAGLTQWTDIAELAADGYGGFVGIKTDGTVLRGGTYAEEDKYDVMDS